MLTVSPPPSERSDTSFRPSQTTSQPITYAGQTKKKKLKRVVDSDDEGELTPSRIQEMS